jgi:hypothetical protein
MFIKYWVGLHPGKVQKTIEIGVEIMMKTAATVMISQETKQAPRRITGGDGVEN